MICFRRTGRAGNKGFAYTFITSDQERSAGDLVKAFELAETPVPEELQKLWDDYVAKMAAEGKHVKTGGGFGGHGYKFDAAEAEAMAKKKTTEKLLHGLTGSDDEDEEEEVSQSELSYYNGRFELLIPFFQLDKQLESMMKSRRNIREANSAEELQLSITGTDAAAASASPQPAGQTNAAALEKARQLARQINATKNLGAGAKVATQTTAEAVMKGEKSTIQVTVSRLNCNY